MRDKPWCYFHARLHRAAIPLSPSRDQTVTIAAPEDPSGISIALCQVINALGENRIDRHRAGLILYGLQIAAKVTSKSDLVSADSVRSLSLNESGDELAPEAFICEPGIDCEQCAHQDDCSNFEDPEENLTYEPCDDEEGDENQDEDDDA